MIPLTDKEKESYENQKVYYICEKEFCTDQSNKKEFKQKQKVRDHCHYTGKYRRASHSIYNLHYKIPKEIPVVFIMDLHMIIMLLLNGWQKNLKAILNKLAKIQKNILLSQCQLKKSTIMLNHLYTG